MPLGAARFGLSGADLGKLELIETQTVSSASALEFTNIKEDIYNVHFMTCNNLQVQTDADDIFLRFYENGVLESASVYQEAIQEGKADGSFGEGGSTGRSSIRVVFGLGTAGNELGHSYMYFYNLGDSAKFSFTTTQWVQLQTSSVFDMAFGSSVLPQASTVNKIRIFAETNTFSGTISLYGIKES
tara:strand:- start:522 stop:1079 length:558 start_codon:yes stop_codon:yes gene_type:complete